MSAPALRPIRFLEDLSDRSQAYGIHRVRDYFERSGSGYLVLHHGCGRWEIEIPEPWTFEGLRAGAVVEVQSGPESDNSRSISFIRVLEPTEYRPSQALPTSWCVDEADPYRLQSLIERLRTSAFRHWMESVVDDLRLMKRFFQVKASYRHHHSVPGGLLRHSVESAEITEQAVATTPGLCSAEITPGLHDGLVLAALFHDIGKTLSHSAGSSWLLRKTDHRHLSLVALSKHLPQLAILSGEAHSILVHLLIQDALGKGYDSPLLLVDTIRMADRMSTGLWMRASESRGWLS
jgi:hypothetical protein